MRVKAFLIIAAATMVCAGCAARRIPGTDIEDNDDTRAILKVIEQYRVAMEARDADGVIKLVADSFKDNGGTATPEDDLDYALLRKKLPERLAKVEEIRLDLSIRKITVNKDTKTATAIYYYNMSFKMPPPSHEQRFEADIKDMSFALTDGQWKITSGV